MQAIKRKDNKEQHLWVGLLQSKNVYLGRIISNLRVSKHIDFKKAISSFRNETQRLSLFR